MNSNLKLTIETTLLNGITKIAAKNKISVNELVEGHFKKLTRSPKQKNIIDLIEKLEKPSINVDVDLKKLYNQQKI